MNIQYVPDELEHCTDLQKLILSNNQLTVVPSVISSLQNIKVLSLSNNPIQHISNDFQWPHKLERLYLSNTSITQVPNSLLKLISLKVLSISDTLETSPIIEQLKARGVLIK